MRPAAEELKKRGYEVATPAFGEAQIKVESGFDVDKKEYYIRRHFKNIDGSDAILVVNYEKNNIANYVGGNTLLEIGHAYTQGLEIFFINPMPEIGYKDELMGMRPIVIDGDLSKIDEHFAGLPKAYISSESPVKHTAISRAFRRAGVRVQLEGIKVVSGVSEQPKSMDETYEGALNRHLQLVKELGDKPGCYLVTIESGIFTPRAEHNYFGTTTLVAEKDGERHVGIDVDLEFPRHMTDRVPSEFKDLGELVKKEYGAAVSDPFPYFTNGKLTRQYVLENALYNVLVQFHGNED